MPPARTSTTTTTPPRTRPTYLYPYNWDAIASLWPVDERDDYLRKREVINNMPLESIIALHNAYRKKKKDQGSGLARGRFSADGVMPTLDFTHGPQTDNGVDTLHLARWERLPLAPPEAWYHLVKQKHSPIMIIAISLEVSGSANQVPPQVIEMLHEQQSSLQCSM